MYAEPLPAAESPALVVATTCTVPAVELYGVSNVQEVIVQLTCEAPYPLTLMPAPAR